MKIKELNGRRWRGLLGICLAFGLASGFTALAQGLPNVPANIEQMPGPSGRRVLAPSAPAMTVVPEDFTETRLAPGYLLQMDVFNVPEMTSNLRVDDRGNLNVPLLGPVHVGGQTVFEAQQAVAEALVRGEILKSPQVTLNVLQYTSSNITVLGEVQFPGRIQLLAPKNLADVLALAGGELLSAGNEIEIRHGSQLDADLTKVHYAQGSSPDSLRSILVKPGDSVFVRRAGIVYVLGAVNRPGGYLMVNGGSLNILQAVALASGTTIVASGGTVRVIRPLEAGKFKTIYVPYKQVSKGHTPPMQLQPEDIVYVPTSTTKTVFIDGSGIISTAASAAIFRFP